MPLLVPCNELKPGMRLAEPFFWRGRMMVAADTALSADDISSLRARFPKNSFRVVDALLDAAIEFEDDSYEREVARTAQRRIAESMSRVNMRCSAQASLDGAAISAARSAVADVIRYLEEHPVSAALVDNFMAGDGYLSQHAGNVFYLSMLLASAALNYVAQERQRQSTAKELEPRTVNNLVPLGLGAMLMDLGMLSLEHLLTEDEPLTPEAWKEIRDHPIAGAALLPEGFSATAKKIVRSHHENFRGGGYPDGVSGDKLHVFARIVRIADAYDAATATRVYKQAKSPARVLWEMSLGPYRRCYDPTLMSTFARLVQPFPIGSKIRLRNGRYAVVVKYNRENPLAPVVIVAFDDQNRRLSNAELSDLVQLGKRPDLRAASFRDEDLSFIYESARDDINRSRVGVWPTLFEAAYP